MSRLHRVLKITADGVPIASISIERAIIDVFKGKLFMIQQQGDAVYRSQRNEFPVPAIVGTTNYHKLPDHYYGEARLTNHTLAKRDHWTCQYCGRRKFQLETDEFITRDHVFPVSRGGEDIWQNVVLACITCNNKKRDRTPQEADMPLLNIPTVPTRWDLNRKNLEVAMEHSDILKELVNDRHLISQGSGV